MRIQRTEADLARIRKSRAVAPSMAALREEFPHAAYETHPVTGEKVSGLFIENHTPDGKRTRDGLKYEEMMRPFARAETERGHTLTGGRPKERLLAADGSIQYVEPHLADYAAAQNGWRSAARLGIGARVERGPDGMLFRYAGGWMPLGVRCLGKPLRGGRSVSRRSIQRDPSGHPWRWMDGAWREADVD